MTSLLVKDLSRSDDLDRKELLAVRGGNLIIQRPPEQGPQLPGFCGTGLPSIPGLPSLPDWPTLPGPSEWWPCAPADPGFDPRRLQ